MNSLPLHVLSLFCLLINPLSSRAAIIFDQCDGDVCEYVMPKGRKPEINPKLLNVRLRSRQQVVNNGPYDYIIIGGGGAGCPLARTLADGGHKTLLIERGNTRLHHKLSQDIYGSGMVIGDERVSQPVITPVGVRTHLGNVLGGGTATGMAIAIEEDAEYMQKLSALSNVTVDFDLYHEAAEWVRPRTAQPMSLIEPYSSRWREGLISQGFNVSHGPTPTIVKDGTWNAYSLFDPGDNYFRNSADILLGTTGNDTQPENLDVVVKTFADRIIFETPPDGTPIARCVVIRATMPRDIAPFDGRSAKAYQTWYKQISRRRSWTQWFEVNSQSTDRDTNIVGEDEQMVCATKEIISSAGAVHSIALMARSGVGNSEQLETLKVKPVKVIEDMGKHLIDRGLLPVAYFRSTPSSHGNELPPQVCGIVGMTPVGPECEGYTIHSKTKLCSMTGAEEITGGRILEGFVYATRILFPPEVRSSTLLEAILSAAAHCSDKLRHSALCSFMTGVSECMRRLTATWYFVNEPKSRGYVLVLPNGNVIVDPKYFSDEQDVEDGLRGLTNLINIAHSGVFGDVMETPSLEACPWLIGKSLNTLSQSVGRWARRIISDKDLETVDTSLNHPKGAAATLLLHRQAEVEAAEDHSSYEELMRQEHDKSKLLSKLRYILEHSEKNPAAINPFWPQHLTSPPTESTWNSSNDVHTETLGMFNLSMPNYTRERSATFPPLMPDVNNRDEMKEYMYSMMQSMWHLAGTASLGRVVDSQFRVKGISNLGIMDASVLTQVTRMNPTQTIMALGRYAGILKLRNLVP